MQFFIKSWSTGARHVKSHITPEGNKNGKKSSNK